MDQDYYKPPAQKIFNDIKKCAIEIWQAYDNTYGYVDEKVGRIKDIPNVPGNVPYIIAMFDGKNKVELYKKLNIKSRVWLIEFLQEEYKGVLDFLTERV